MLGITAPWLCLGYGVVRWLPKGGLRYYGYRMVSYIVGRMFLFSSGHLWVTEQTARIEDYLPDYHPSSPLKESEACLIVGNHVSQCDIFYMIQRFGVSFVGKAESRNMLPLKWAGESCGAIWVDRS